MAVSHTRNRITSGKRVQAGVTAESTAVALDDVTVAFGPADAQPYIAVEQARLSVADGEFVAIVGPTGCGKSTLLNVAAGLLRPISGGVRIFDAALAGVNRDAGYLLCAEYERQLGGGSPLSSLMTAKD